jgi:hypothetical protein
MRASEVGLLPGTVVTGSEAVGMTVGIDTAKALVLPTTANGLNPGPHGGVLECYITVEGTGGAGFTGSCSRYRWDGVAPTTTRGLLLAAPSEFVPATLVLVGYALIAAFQIIGTAAGNKISYSYLWRDVR